MGAPDIPAGHPPAERDDDHENEEQPENLEDFEAEVEDPVQEHGAEKAGEDDLRPLLLRPELRRPECKAPDAGEDHVAGHRGDRPDDAHRDPAFHHVQDILDGGKPEAGSRCVHDPVHRLVELGMAVDGEVHDKELQGLLDHRGNDRGREDAFREGQLENAGGDAYERPEEEDPGEEVQRLGFVAVLPVDIEEDEEGRGDGEEEEFQHHRNMGNRI